jgi:hypothetical protein
MLVWLLRIRKLYFKPMKYFYILFLAHFFSISFAYTQLFGGQIKGSKKSISALNCGTASNTGTLLSGVVANSVSSSVPYTGGNGGTHNGQIINSTGVTGLTATLAAGNFAVGAGNLTYIITGTPSSIGTAGFALNIGGQNCTLTRTVLALGTITALNCGTATNTGTLTSGTAASGVSSSVSYIGGNGGTHNGQTVNSSGVTGLTATLTAGVFASGAGSLTYTITGSPSTSGTASFAINIGGQICYLTIIVYGLQPSYPVGSVFCGFTTIVNDVINPSTGKIWMDRHLGASQVATISTDVAAYGDLYQWGRRSDGHQCRNSTCTSTLSSSSQPPHGNFITTSSVPNDWQSPQNTNLWQGVNGINNPCPSGYRVPTSTEINAERLSWSSNDGVGAFASPLKIPRAGQRSGHPSAGCAVGLVGCCGALWTSTVSGTSSIRLYFSGGPTELVQVDGRSIGQSVRCIKN